MSRRLKFFYLPFMALAAHGGSCAPHAKHDRSNREAYEFKKVAKHPPMGWNSWDVYGADVTEEEVRATAAVMASTLKPLGYQYVVIDIAWYAPEATAVDEGYKRPRPKQLIDGYGRLVPTPVRFPSAKAGSFKPLADELHAMGLKLGLHIMRGIPRQAVEQNTPIKGTPYRARDIVTYEKACTFYDGMLSIDMTKPGAQAYYDSIVELYASWGIDFLKADDMTSYPHKLDEPRALRLAIEKVKHPIVLSLSPGAVNVWDRNFLSHHADMYRISGDFWDEWEDLRAQFQKAHLFGPYTGPFAWADLDMIPFGRINVRGERGQGARQARFVAPEARTLMALWTIFRSPLMLGMELTQLNDETRALITNADAIRIDQTSINNREVRFVPNQEVVWAADAPDATETYAALFNISDEPRTIATTWRELGLAAKAPLAYGAFGRVRSVNWMVRRFA